MDLDRWREAYFRWLVGQVERQGHRTYWDLLRLMHRKEFIWLVPNDDNRIGDGIALRHEFLEEVRVKKMTREDFGACSVLEVMIALSRRIAFVVDDEVEYPERWAVQLIRNLNLHKMTDPLSEPRALKADEILEVLIWRRYAPDGSGGFFPLNNPREDQTKVEIWTQMNAYALEIHPNWH